MASYTSLTTKEIDEILGLYGLGQAINVRPMLHGISNTNYLITLAADAKEVLLKVSNDKDFNEVESEMRILDHLQSQGFSYCLIPLKLPNGESVYRYGPHHGAIFPKALGEVAKIDAQTCFAMGEVLAKLHLIPTSGAELRIYPSVGHDLEKITNYCTLPQCPPDFKAAFQNLVQQRGWSEFVSYYNSLPPVLIHGDLYYDNVFFKNNKITVLLDFEQAGIGNPILDLGIAISGSCLKGGQLDDELIRQYVRGYQSVHKHFSLPPTLLPVAVGLGLLSISLWRIERFLERNLSEAKKYSYQKLLQLIRLNV
jgi:homoserine kinase type II